MPPGVERSTPSGALLGEAARGRSAHEGGPRLRACLMTRVVSTCNYQRPLRYRSSFTKRHPGALRSFVPIQDRAPRRRPRLRAKSSSFCWPRVRYNPRPPIPPVERRRTRSSRTRLPLADGEAGEARAPGDRTACFDVGPRSPRALLSVRNACAPVTESSWGTCVCPEMCTSHARATCHARWARGVLTSRVEQRMVPGRSSAWRPCGSSALHRDVDARAARIRVRAPPAQVDRHLWSTRAHRRDVPAGRRSTAAPPPCAVDAALGAVAAHEDAHARAPQSATAVGANDGLAADRRARRRLGRRARRRGRTSPSNGARLACGSSRAARAPARRPRRSRRARAKGKPPPEELQTRHASRRSIRGRQSRCGAARACGRGRWSPAARCLGRLALVARRLAREEAVERAGTSSAAEDAWGRGARRVHCAPRRRRVGGRNGA